MTAHRYDVVQALASWDGNPSHYPQTHARESLPVGMRVRASLAARRPALCGMRSDGTQVIATDPYYALADQVSCQRCTRILAARRRAELGL